MKPIIYKPVFKDVEYCMEVAKYREDINRKLCWETGDKKFAIMNHFVGAYGELAISKIFGIEWEGAKLDMLDYQEWRKTKPDLGIFEVKTINFPSGCLILNQNDKDWATAILVLAAGSWQIGSSLLSGSTRLPPLQLIYVLGHLKVELGKQVGTPQVTKNSHGNTKTRYIIKRDQLRDAQELRGTMSGFDKLRKTKPELTMHGTTFRLTKWVM